MWKDDTVKFLEVKYYPSQEDSDSQNTTLRPGFVKYCRHNKSLLVKCVDNKFIEIFKLSIGKKKAMSAADFNNGFLGKFQESDRYFT